MENLTKAAHQTGKAGNETITVIFRFIGSLLFWILSLVCASPNVLTTSD